MAVLGGVKYNKDPNLMPKYVIGGDHVLMGRAGNFDSSESSYFWTGDYTYNAQTTDNVVANTDITIVNISGKAGFMTGALSMGNGLSAGNATNFTWTITVDGVATTILMEAGSRGVGFTPAGARSMLGPFFNGTYSSGFQWALMENNYSYDSVGWDNTGPSYRSIDATSGYLMNAEHARQFMPQSCVRFETSLNVKVQMNKANTGNYEKQCGVQYILDRGNY
tara:strand:+ start:39 stop:704 length:666 start_codon:yes stop_codon:yes gene_type:complete